MEIQGRDVLILGGSGLVGMAVAREMLRLQPARLVICGLAREEAESAVEELRLEPDGGGVALEAEWGDIFLPQALKDRARDEVLGDASARALLLDDLLGELSDDVLRRSALGSLIDRRRPHIVVDSVNTATAFAYQNIFASAAELRAEAADTGASLERIERHLATLYMPQLIRHVQIALESMRRAGTGFYIKIGTSGTGGMGLNIPFTHSEERPSRTLLAKAGVAGAHTLLLYLMARTPGAPAVKEVKPTAAISWKRIGFGAVTRRGRRIPRFDATAPVPLETAFAGASDFVELEGDLEGVYIDAGENGVFSLGEFEALSALGLMEYITPEEIAEMVVREIRGYPTGRDVVGALDAATAGPTYRAGVLREAALERMASLEREHGVDAVAYEMLGPPRLSKLLFEAAILARLCPDLRAAAALDPEDAAHRAETLIRVNHDLRVRMLSIGLPILLRDGTHLLRGPEVKVPPERGQSPADPRLVENGWVDLRPSNWRKWSHRAGRMVAAIDRDGTVDEGSRADIEPDPRRLQIRPGAMAAWVFRVEDRGVRIKR